MSRPVDLDAVLARSPGHWVILGRGCLKHCPRCGGGHLYRGWFRMKERCPSCGYLFEREPGFFVGAYTINLVITQGIIVVLLFAFVLWKSGHPEAGVVGPATAGAIIAVVAPLAFYPFSRTLWSAFDLAFTPLDLKEIVDAVDALEADALLAGGARETGDIGATDADDALQIGDTADGPTTVDDDEPDPATG